MDSPLFYGPKERLQSDDWLSRRLLQSLEDVGPRYTYDVEFDIDGVQATGTVNMAAPNGQRLVVHTPSSDQWGEESTSEVNAFEKNLDDDLWCQELMEDVDGYSGVAVDTSGLMFDVRADFVAFEQIFGMALCIHNFIFFELSEKLPDPDGLMSAVEV